MRRKYYIGSGSNMMSLAAVFVGICALVVSIYQSRIFRKQQFATVWPYIEPKVEYSNNTFALILQNKGTGPAIMKDMAIELDGIMTTNYQTFLKDLLHTDKFKGISISVPRNTVLSAGERVEVLSAQLQDSVFIQQTDFGSRTVLRLCYCSIFGDCWNYEDGKVTETKECK
ncbi:MAG: hypothetical protein ABI844_06700 [Saprospiraceae bacterium]